MALYTVPDPTRCGIVALGRGRITRFVEKPALDAVFGNLANVGRLRRRATSAGPDPCR